MTSDAAAEPSEFDTSPVTPEGETNRFDDFLDNLEETDAPPKEVPPQRGRKAKIPREPKVKKPLPRWKDGAISAYAEKIYKAAGAAALLNHDPEIRHIGQQMIECAYQCGEAWEKVAKRNELVRRFFDRIMTTSDMGELFWAHIPILIPILRKFGPFRSNFANIQEQFEEEFANQEAA
jgi:hypothetical protein